jgi:hypothetical protein
MTRTDIHAFTNVGIHTIYYIICTVCVCVRLCVCVKTGILLTNASLMLISSSHAHTHMYALYPSQLVTYSLGSIFLQVQSSIRCHWTGYFDSESPLAEYIVGIGDQMGLTDESLVSPVHLPGIKTRFAFKGE